MPDRPSQSEPSSSEDPLASRPGRPAEANGPEPAHCAQGDSSRPGIKAAIPFSPLPPPRASASEKPAASTLPKDGLTTGPGAAGLAPSEDRPWWSRPAGWRISGFLASLAFHASLLVLLALLAQSVRSGAFGGALVAYLNAPETLETITEPFQSESQPSLVRTDEPGAPAVSRSTAATEVTLAEAQPPGRRIASAAIGLESVIPAGLARLAAVAGSGGIEGRSSGQRGRLAAEGGGSAASEAAVEAGLGWLAAHQLDSGSWNFNHQQGLCQGMCRNPGSATSTTAATGLALAPFLGAGYTHQQGEHKDTVRRGIYYLTGRARVGSQGADFREGGPKEGMYGQGMAAMALSEAYAMTADSSLTNLAQRTLDFVDYSQDKRGGGWRYNPGDPGDMTVTGWQLMAMKSGRIARLKVSPAVFYLAAHFLDSVQSDQGAQYGYLTPEPRQSTTAIGLLCRMYLGWSRDHPGLKRGVQLLDKWGPSKLDMYYNYYATQVMRHWGGTEWQKWNYRMREYLISTQARQGHEAGSWHFADPKTESGGRLYNTAMAIMILEVYYRYMPLYGKEVLR